MWVFVFVFFLTSVSFCQDFQFYGLKFMLKLKNFLVIILSNFFPFASVCQFFPSLTPIAHMWLNTVSQITVSLFYFFQFFSHPCASFCIVCIEQFSRTLILFSGVSDLLLNSFTVSFIPNIVLFGLRFLLSIYLFSSLMQLTTYSLIFIFSTKKIFFFQILHLYYHSTF